MLKAADVKGSIWINGSFTTEKIDPDDIDIAMPIDALAYDGGTPQFRQMIDSIGPSLKMNYRCHGNRFFYWPQGHAHYWFGVWQQAYWLRQWGYSSEPQPTMKGIAVVTLA